MREYRTPRDDEPLVAGDEWSRRDGLWFSERYQLGKTPAECRALFRDDNYEWRRPIATDDKASEVAIEKAIRAADELIKALEGAERKPEQVALAFEAYCIARSKVKLGGEK